MKILKNKIREQKEEIEIRSPFFIVNKDKLGELVKEKILEYGFNEWIEETEFNLVSMTRKVLSQTKKYDTDYISDFIDDLKDYMESVNESEIALPEDMVELGKEMGCSNVFYEEQRFEDIDSDGYVDYYYANAFFFEK